MIKKIYLLAAILHITACASWRTDPTSKDSDDPERIFEPSESTESPEFLNNSQDAVKTDDLNTQYFEQEISRLNTKVESLETKLATLSETIEQQKIKAEQPPIEVPQKVDEPPTAQATTAMVASPKENVETMFRTAVDLFKNGKYLEAYSHFNAVTQEYPDHLLASHALYWAGEASAREQQWAMATKSWHELERVYPRSFYIADALAGLSLAYKAQGMEDKANYYKNSLLNAFPNAPATLQYLAQVKKDEP